MDNLVIAAHDDDVGRLRQLLHNRKKARASSQDPNKERNASNSVQNACEAAAGSSCIAALELLLDEGGRIEAGGSFELMLHHLHKLIVYRN